MAADCAHHFPFEPAPNCPYYTVRCAHIEPRFVVEIANSESGWRMVDYVEKQPDGALVVETCDIGVAAHPELTNRAWQSAMERMERGETPRVDS